MKVKSIAGYMLILPLILSISSCIQDSNKLALSNPNSSVNVYRNFPEQRSGDTVIVGIAKINKLPNGSMEYLFNERQARYTVAADRADAAAILKLAQAAFNGKQPLRLISERPGTLNRLESPSATEIAVYFRQRKNDLVNPEPIRPFNFKDTDSLTFNLATWQKWKVFRLCKKVIPDLAAAKALFTFCRQQTCVIGPTQIQPCIPFKYAKDGCFARAHKMRWIIEQRYGYCSEKVFSFGALNVKATLSGDCCIDWWYHVAPVVRVMVKGIELLYVIDPSMFTGPVPLLTWLSAQENTSCNANADVTSYSIQPSSAYYPVGAPPNNTYATDPNYTDTNGTLVFFAGLGQTCDNNP
jgi:hypothetical protein